MNIDKKYLRDLADSAYWQCNNSKHIPSLEAAIDAVLAEVAKHNAPDKPAYYDPSLKPPTKADAPSGYIITYDLTVNRWVDATWEYVAGHPQHYLAWYCQPDKPITKDDEARENLLDLIREEGIGLPLGSDAILCRVWDAALAHRDKPKP